MLKVLFEDNHVIAVVKPAKVLTASDKTQDKTLLQMVRDYNASKQGEGKKGYLVPLHFLDRPVSGIVLFARSSKAASRLSQQFREGKVQKTYVAMVEASRTPKADDLEDYLVKNRDTNVVEVTGAKTDGAKKCRLKYRALKQGSKLAWLEITPLTGRSHQIRVQLSSRGMPIYGDVKYGSRNSWNGVIALHATKVNFEHPTSKENVEISLAEPEDWAGIWAAQSK